MIKLCVSHVFETTLPENKNRSFPLQGSHGELCDDSKR